jgi:hypothetical protein
VNALFENGEIVGSHGRAPYPSPPACESGERDLRRAASFSRHGRSRHWLR